MPPRRIRRPPKQGWLVVLVVAALLAWRWFQEGQFNLPPAAPPGGQASAARKELAPGVYAIDHVVDGDTLELVGGERVRLLGVDTPETVKPEHPVEAWGPEAAAFAKDFLHGGRVRLEFDQERRDKYGRLLAYAYVGERMLNEELIRSGLGRTELNHPFSPVKKARFRAALAEAQRGRLGLWSTPRPVPMGR
jgi:endonuclease YncB( thermonuclease family)